MNTKLMLVLTLSFSIISFPLAFAQQDLEEDSFSGIELPASVTGQDLDPLYEPTLETLSELGTSFAESIVLIIGFLVTIFVGWIIGRLVESALKRVIKRVFEHEKLLKAVGMNKDEFAESNWSRVHNLIPFTVKWFVWLIFFVVAVDLLQIPQATEALTELWTWIPRLVVFILLISVGFIASRIALKWMVETKPELFGDSGTIQVAKGIVQAIIFAVIFGIGITTLGIGQDIIPILFWVILSGIMGMAIAISVGLRHTARLWSIGESIKKQGIDKEVKIKVDTFEGTVKNVGVTHVKITEGEKTILIPNSLFEQKSIELTKEKVDDDEKK